VSPAFLLVLAAALAPAAGALAPPVQDGDIVFHTSRSRQSLAVQRSTGSRYSHMGVVLKRGRRPFVFEAIATVRYTPLDAWIARGKDGHVVVKRLKNAHATLTTDALVRLRRSAGRYEGRPYDLTFEWSDHRIYCSELVWKMYRDALGIEIGALQKLGEFKLDDPLVKAKMEERYRGRPPLDEAVIAPGAMFDSPLLETVAEK